MSLRANDYVVSETSNHPDANDDGTVTVEPGETKSIVEFQPGGSAKAFHLLALGATDAPDCRFRLRSAGAIVTTTESPHGPLNDEFSFVKEFGRPIRMARYGMYEVQNIGDTERDFAARMHCEVLRE